DAVLAGVAGAADDAALAAVLRRGGVVVGQLAGVGGEQPAAQVERLRPLDRDHAGGGGLVGDGDVAGALVLLQPVEDLGAVGGVDDHGPAVGPAVDQDVVADPAVLVAEQAVAGLHVLHGGGVVAEDELDEVERAGPGEGQ